MRETTKKKNLFGAIGIGLIALSYMIFFIIHISIDHSAGKEREIKPSDTSFIEESRRNDLSDSSIHEEEITESGISKKSETPSKDSSKSPTKESKLTNTSKLDSAGNEDFSEMERPTLEEINHAQSNREGMSDQVVGEIEIPAIQLKLSILEGTTYQKMLYGATTLLANPIMGRGNYALASHNMGVEGSMFTSIYQLKEGEDIYLKDKQGKTYHYQVISNDVVDFRNTEKLNLTRKPTITLITCQTVQTTDNRVIVQGELVE